MQKGQGALEYLLLIGGAVLVAVIVITLLLGIAEEGETSTRATTTAVSNLLAQKRAELFGSGIVYTFEVACEGSENGWYYNLVFSGTEDVPTPIEVDPIIRFCSTVDPLVPGIGGFTYGFFIGSGRCDAVKFNAEAGFTISELCTGSCDDFQDFRIIYVGDTASYSTTSIGSSITIAEGDISSLGRRWPGLINSRSCTVYATGVVS